MKANQVRPARPFVLTRVAYYEAIRQLGKGTAAMLAEFYRIPKAQVQLWNLRYTPRHY